MKQYLRNLCLALCGNNPYQVELTDVREKYEKAAERVESLQELYFKGVELYDAVSRHVAGLEKLVADGKEQEKTQQGRDFRDRMERMKADYQRRIDEYTAEIDRLKGEGHSVTDHNGQSRDGE